MSHGEKRKGRQALALYARLMRAESALSGALHAPLPELGLSVSQFGVLEALKHKGPLELGQLARAILRTSGNLTMVVDNLERDGLVRRQRSEKDRRRIVVTLTPQGRETIDKVFPAHAQLAAELMDVLDVNEKRQLSRLLRKLYKEE